MLFLICWLIIVIFVLLLFLLMSTVMGESVFYIDNLIVFTTSFFSYFAINKLIIPTLMSPKRFYAGVIGTRKVPWEPPGFIVDLFLFPIILYFYLNFFCMLGLRLYSLRECNRAGTESSVVNASPPAMMGTLTSLLVFFIPFMRIPAIFLGDMIPFIEDMIYGLPVGLVTFYMYYSIKSGHARTTCR